jgi:protein SCO1/2
MNKIYILHAVSLIVCLILLGFLGYAWSSIASRQSSHPSAEQGLIPVGTERFGAPFTLKNHLGENVSEKTYDGQYRLLYFGFTYCPAICPTGLQKITQAINGLGPDGEKVQPIFITVDPERDTVEVMKNYVSMFHPRLVGYTGAPHEITKVLKGYKIYAAKVEDPQMSEYTMDHSSFTYLIGPDGNLLHIFKHEDTSDIMTDVMRRWMIAKP